MFAGFGPRLTVSFNCVTKPSPGSISKSCRRPPVGTAVAVLNCVSPDRHVSVTGVSASTVTWSKEVEAMANSGLTRMAGDVRALNERPPRMGHPEPAEFS